MYGRFVSMLSMCLAACLATMSAAVSFASRMAKFAVNAVALPDIPRAFVSPPLASGGGAVGIAPALYQRNRHEAGVSHRSAARNT